ncbi:MAG: efflux RND transporter permease subunit [Brevinematia bacterium]
MWGLLKGLLNNIPAVIMILAAIIVLGIVAGIKLPVDLFPNIEFPVVAIRIDYPGASPETVEQNIARILEGQFLTVNGVKNVISRCFEGFLFITVEFEYGVNLDQAANDIREKIDFVSKLLPSDASKPQIFKFDPSILPIMNISISGIDDLSALREIAQDTISKRLSQIEGVANVTVNGGYDKKVFVELDTKKLNSFGISPSDVVSAISRENQNIPSGQIISGYKKISIRFSSEYKNTEEIKDVLVGNRKGYPVKVRDVANVEFKPDTENATIVKVNGQPGIVLSINKKSGSSTVDVSEKVRKKIEELKKDYPNLNFTIITDQGDFIVKSLNNVKDNAINGALLAVIVVFFFLVSIKETILIGLAIPISIVITLVSMYFLGISLNVISLAGLALGVGMMVDNSIVVIESIYLKTKQGKNPIEAAFEGTKEVGVAILGSTLTTIFVFAPLVFTQGLASQIFKDLAATVSISIFSSLLVAIFIVPPLESRYWSFVDKFDQFIQRNKLLFFFSELILKIRDTIYESLLKSILGLKKTMLVFTIIFLALGILSFIYIGKELLPIVDSGDINVTITFPQGTYKDITSKYAEEVGKYLETNENVKYFYYVINTSSSGLRFLVRSSGENTINITVKLKDIRERNISSEEFSVELRKFLTRIPGKSKVDASSGVIRIPGGGANADMKLIGDDIEELKRISSKIEEIGRKISGIQEINSSLDDPIQEYIIYPDKNKLSYYGISSLQLGNSIKTGFLGTTASFFRLKGKQYEIFVQLKNDDRKYLEDILYKYIPTPLGLVPIIDLVKISNGYSPQMIMRENNSRTVSLSLVGYNIAQTKLVELIDKEVKKNVYIPPNITISYGGSFKELQNTFRDLVLVFILSLVLVYSTMVVLFKSFKDPFIIIFTVPYGVFSVLIIFLLLGLKINIISAIGLIIILGIVVNNGIVMVDYMNQLLERGYKLRDAIIEGAKRRFRPILMTSLTTIIGLLPIAFGLGESGELYQPLGQTIFIGMTLGTLFTLFIVPIIYEYFNRKRFS